MVLILKFLDMESKITSVLKCISIESDATLYFLYITVLTACVH